MFITLGRRTPCSQRERELESANPRMRAASRCLRPRALRYLRSWFRTRPFLAFFISESLMASSYSECERMGKAGKDDAGGKSGAERRSQRRPTGNSRHAVGYHRSVYRGRHVQVATLAPKRREM